MECERGGSVNYWWSDGWVGRLIHVREVCLGHMSITEPETI